MKNNIYYILENFKDFKLKERVIIVVEKTGKMNDYLLYNTPPHEITFHKSLTGAKRAAKLRLQGNSRLQWKKQTYLEYMASR